jgi:hypothetical protein
MLERRGRHAEAARLLAADDADPRSAGCRPRPRRRVVLGLDDLLTR